ncbi:7966_t:CDS:2 [Entrophospora sp. SA101]|nr:14699_t:CDS:2 [Entrophospora sp. SA101]CAJ0635189.1 7966_t:CDS:2 [Entrophospora sp. SA101]CAJ0827584.1 7285_t:CDS:2 [Entrophospora sp. SA101]CAJ0893328.1 7725_t:CDS:2 [Entrophospora sp. SA101]CAJ0914037.1 4374_t:CDS:2 [Entrophospora sp. SA101]
MSESDSATPTSNSSDNDSKVNNNGEDNNNEASTTSDNLSPTNEIKRLSSASAATTTQIAPAKTDITSTETTTNDTVTATGDVDKATINSSNNTKAFDAIPKSSTDDKSAVESSDCVVKTEEIWTSNNSSTYPFGPYPPKPTKTYENHTLDPVLFNDPSMKLTPVAAASTTTAPVNYYGQSPIGLAPHETANYAMAPTPQEYASIAALNGGASFTVTNDKPQTISPRVSSPQAMMTTFNSRTISSTPKRYKCDICQKRFTRPSSLQTHMYSHTGEKLEGCGRHFSVVSNLRRHQKIHGNNNDASPNVTNVTPSTT